MLSMNIEPAHLPVIAQSAPKITIPQVVNSHNQQFASSPVINAPNNQLKIQNVFSIQKTLPNNVIGVVQKPSTANANASSTTINMPSFPMIQAVASLAASNGSNRPVEQKANSSETNNSQTTTKPMIRAIPTAALQALKPVPILPKPAGMRPILLPKPNTSLPITTVVNPQGQAFSFTKLPPMGTMIAPNIIVNRLPSSKQSAQSPSSQKLVYMYRKSDGSVVLNPSVMNKMPPVAKPNATNTNTKLPTATTTTIPALPNQRANVPIKIHAPPQKVYVNPKKPILISKNVPSTSTSPAPATIKFIPKVVPATEKRLHSIERTTARVNNAKNLAQTRTSLPVEKPTASTSVANDQAKPSTSTSDKPKPTEVCESIEISDSSDDEDAGSDSSPSGDGSSSPAQETVKLEIVKPLLPKAPLNVTKVRLLNELLAASKQSVPKAAPTPPPPVAENTISSTAPTIYPISGFLISDNIPLGKLMARLNENNIIIQVPGLKSHCKFRLGNSKDLTQVDNYLDKLVDNNIIQPSFIANPVF